MATDHAGFAGPGFVAELNQGSRLTERIMNVPADGTYSLNVRYANGNGGDGLHQTRTATVTAAGTQSTLSFPVTTDWDTWGTASVPVTLTAGTNDVTIGCPDATSCHVNARHDRLRRRSPRPFRSRISRSAATAAAWTA